MIGASLVFLTPGGALLALVGVVPLGALAVAALHVRRARNALGLGGARSVEWWKPASVVMVSGFLGLAASQPVIRTSHSLEVRTDAQAIYVIDDSRSMLAAPAPGGRTRISRARDEAIALRDRLLDIPSGVATLNDSVLPSLMPVSDPSVFEQTIRQAIRVDNPPPASDAVTATDLGALAAVGTQNFFPASAKRRIVIVFTDGESSPFDVKAVGDALAHSPRVVPVFVHVSAPGEAVYDANGKAEPGYHPDPASGETLAQLAQAAGGSSFREDQLASAARAVRAAAGSGPMEPQGLTVSTSALAPYAVLLALLPLVALVGWLPRTLTSR